MSFKKVEKKETNTYEIEFLIDKKVFDEACDKAYHKNAAKMNVPGFRKGHAPRAIIEKMYGAGVFYDDAINACLPTAYEDAEKEAKKEIKNEIIGQPEFEAVSIDENGVMMKAVVTTKPDVTIKDYFGIEAEKETKTASDEEVDAEIQRMRERNSREIEITDRAAKNDDTVVIDFDGYIDEKQFNGGKGENYDLKLGSGSFIPGFEEQIVGKNIGDEFDVNVSFPADYHAAELAGKPAVFKVKLHSIKETELPALDDEFAKDVSEFNTFAEYKADVKAKLNERLDKEADAVVDEAVTKTLIDLLEAEIPEVMYTMETENFVRDYDSRLRMQGLDLSTYFKYTKQTLDDLRKQMRPQAEQQVKARLALEKIAELENVVAEDADLDAEYARMAETYSMEVDKIKELVPKENLADDIKVRKAFELVKSKAKVSEKKAEKKPAAKKAAKETK